MGKETAIIYPVKQLDSLSSFKRAIMAWRAEELLPMAIYSVLLVFRLSLFCSIHSAMSFIHFIFIFIFHWAPPFHPIRK